MRNRDSQARSISKSQSWFGLKRVIKSLINILPGYNAIVSLLKPFTESHQWINRLPVADDNVLVISADTQFVMTTTSRCEIAKGLWWSNGRVQPSQDAFALLLFQMASKEAEIVLDIGANTGLFSLAAARCNPLARVLAFDLQPEAIQILQRNVLANDLARQIYPLLMGVGAPDESFKVPLSINAGVLPSSISTDFEFEEGVSVPINSLDQIGQWIPESSKVAIKIDVEGTEDQIFCNGSKFLQNYRPDMVCEVLSRSIPESYQDRLSQLGYRFFSIRESCIVEFDVPSGHQKYRDWLITTFPSRYQDFVNKHDE